MLHVGRELGSLISEPYREHCIHRHGFRPAPDTSKPRAYPTDSQTLAELPFKLAEELYQAPRLPQTRSVGASHLDLSYDVQTAMDEPPPLISIHDVLPRAQ